LSHGKIANSNIYDGVARIERYTKSYMEASHEEVGNLPEAPFIFQLIDSGCQVLSVYVALEKAGLLVEDCPERRLDRRKTDEPMNRIMRTTNLADIRVKGLVSRLIFSFVPEAAYTLRMSRAQLVQNRSRLAHVQSLACCRIASYPS
jgi:hypothetical protein